MDNFINKINEFATYLLSINIDEKQINNINGIFINSPDFIKLQFVQFLRPENNNENDDTDINDIKRSQINEFIYNFGLSDDSDNIKILNDYLLYFLSIKNSE